METVSLPELMNRMMTGFWTTQSLYVAAKLGIADLLAHGPRSADDLAQAANVHAPSLYRLLRGLASMGVFAEDDTARFSLTPVAECLRSDVPGSQRALAITGGKERTEEEYPTLYKAGGFQLARIVPTRAEVSVIEGKKL